MAKGAAHTGEALFCHAYTLKQGARTTSLTKAMHENLLRYVMGPSKPITTPPCRHLKALWWLMSSKCVTVLWLQQNQVMHEGVELMQASCTQELRQTIFRQLRALRKIRGAKLKLCLELLEVSPREAPQQEMGRMQPPGSVETPALITAYYT
ncbi:hypothetical protein GQ600_19255 [Phytophthora cactorum]|nr:hypothetical protein GQ600_19255 [Phytophthora cactorum]